MVFMVSLETTVVTTSLVTISDELGGFSNSSWLVSGYLLGYVGELQTIREASQAVLGPPSLKVPSQL